MNTMKKEFDYREAFSRSLGWLTEQEQQILSTKRVAIAGLGGVGGDHLLNLTRLGIGKFNISDLDAFEIGNFNRQAGASMSTIGTLKVYGLEDMAKDINPELEIRTFPEGIDAENVEAFMKGVDLYVDSLDIFAVEARRLIFDICARDGIPAITAAPLGMGTSMVYFKPGKMTFEQYVGWNAIGANDNPLVERVLRFLVAVSPKPTQLKYLVDPSRVDFLGRKTPSTPMAIHLAAGVVGSYAVKILLGRGKVICAPRSLHFDAYLNTFRVIWRPWGYRNPLQKLTLRFVKRKLLKPFNKIAGC